MAVNNWQRLWFGGLLLTGVLAVSSVRADDKVWVVRSDGAQSCENGSGQSLEKGAGELSKSKVQVFESKKEDDGKMHAAACGIPKGSLNAYLIPKSKLKRAAKLGFKEKPTEQKTQADAPAKPPGTLETH